MKFFVLVAFPYFDKGFFNAFSEIPKEKYELWIDSGAFTAHTIGKKITLDQYHNFLDKASGFNVKAKVQLDVIGNEKKTWENFLESKKQGFDVNPVFTRGSDLKSLDRMYEYDDYVFIGGIHGTKRPNFVKKILMYNKNRKCHLLGFCDTDFIKHFKPYSVDVSSWMAAARYGNLQVYVGGGKLKTINKNDFSRGIPKKLIKYFLMLKVPPEQLRWLGKNAAWRISGRFEWLNGGKGISGFPFYISAMGWLLRQYDIYKHTKTRLVFAASPHTYLRMAIAARDHLIKVGLIKEDL